MSIKTVHKSITRSGLVILAFVYLLLGATMFNRIEMKNNTELEKRVRLQCKQMQLKFNFSIRSLKDTERAINGLSELNNESWNYASALYFTVAVVTTIGYGNLTPLTKTDDGEPISRLLNNNSNFPKRSSPSNEEFEIEYAIWGIPLCIVMFQALSENIKELIQRLVSFIHRRLPLYSLKHKPSAKTCLRLISGVLTLIVVSVGMLVFHQFEQWSYLDCVYYCFVTLTTIGFGDYVAFREARFVERNKIYFLMVLGFIMFGLAAVALNADLLVIGFLKNTTSDSYYSVVSRPSIRGSVDISKTNGKSLKEKLIMGKKRKPKRWKLIGIRKRKRLPRYTVQPRPVSISHLVQNEHDRCTDSDCIYCNGPHIDRCAMDREFCTL